MNKEIKDFLKFAAIYNQGRDAYFSGAECPYAPNTNEFGAWIAGFDAQHEHETTED